MYLRQRTARQYGFYIPQRLLDFANINGIPYTDFFTFSKIEEYFSIEDLFSIVVLNSILPSGNEPSIIEKPYPSFNITEIWEKEQKTFDNNVLPVEFNDSDYKLNDDQSAKLNYIKALPVGLDKSYDVCVGILTQLFDLDENLNTPKDYKQKEYSVLSGYSMNLNTSGYSLVSLNRNVFLVGIKPFYLNLSLLNNLKMAFRSPKGAAKTIKHIHHDKFEFNLFRDIVRLLCSNYGYNDIASTKWFQLYLQIL